MQGSWSFIRVIQAWSAYTTGTAMWVNSHGNWNGLQHSIRAGYKHLKFSNYVGSALSMT